MRSPLFPIFLTVFVDVLGLTLILPLLTPYAEHFGATPFQVGALTSVYAGCMFLSSPALGRLSDRIGRKPVLVFSQVGTLIGWLVLAFASNLEMIFLGRIIAGLTAGNLGVAQAYISDVTKPEERTRMFAFFGIAFGTGFLFGPAISGPLAQRYGFSAPAFAAAVLSVIAILVTAFLLPARKPAPSTQGLGPRRSAFGFVEYLGRQDSRKRLIEFFLFSLSFASLTGGLQLYLSRQLHYNVEQSGYVFAFSGLIGALVQGGGIRSLVKRFGEEKLSAIGMISMATGYVALGAAHTLLALVPIIILSSFGAAVVRPSMTTLVTKTVGENEQGGVIGASQGLGSLAQIIGPPVACELIGRGHSGYYGLLCGTSALVGFVLLLLGKPSEPAIPSTTAEQS